MEDRRENIMALSDEELGGITGGAAVKKGQMMRLFCDDCKRHFFADVTKKVIYCKHCGVEYKLDG